jgi:hypothetical protein
MIEIKIKLEIEMLEALFKGKKLIYQQSNGNEFELTIYPPNYGIFLTNEEYRQVKETCFNRLGSTELFDKIEKRRETKICNNVNYYK